MSKKKKEKMPADNDQQANLATKAKFKRGKEGKLIPGKTESRENDGLTGVKGFPDVSWP